MSSMAKLYSPFRKPLPLFLLLPLALASPTRPSFGHGQSTTLPEKKKNEKRKTEKRKRKRGPWGNNQETIKTSGVHVSTDKKKMCIY